jgi:3-hydroxyacyl-CoA dehydrogenase
LQEKSILGTNTSALPITEFASVTNRGDSIIGNHFMNRILSEGSGDIPVSYI